MSFVVNLLVEKKKKKKKKKNTLSILDYKATPKIFRYENLKIATHFFQKKKHSAMVEKVQLKPFSLFVSYSLTLKCTDYHK